MIGWWLACVPAPDQPQPPAEPFLDAWRDLEAYEAQLTWWDTVPGVSLEVLGWSAEDRPLWALRIRDPVADPGLPVVLVTGLQHAREWIGGTAAMHIAEQLIQGTDPLAREVLQSWEVVVVPVVNPDGYRFSWTTDRLWRKNRTVHTSGALGVDLNRNWGEAWGAPGASDRPEHDNFRGVQAFSTPETSALASWVASEPRVAVHLDLHSPGQLVLFPWGHTASPSPRAAELASRAGAAASAMQAAHDQPYGSDSFHEGLYPASGLGIDWTHAAGLESFLIELRDRGQYGFMLADPLRRPTSDEAWVGFVALVR